MPLIQRVQRILFQPAQTWPVIAGEPATAASIYTRYVMVLAAIPALATFVGLSVFGIGGFGVSVRMPLGAGLAQAVLSYGLTLAAVFVLALVADALAPVFGGTKNPLNALKLIAYAGTAGFVGGIFALVPMLWILSLLASLYGIYLLYTGVPVLMKTSREKALPYTAVLIVCGIVAMAVLGGAASLFMPSPAMTGSVSIGTPGGELAVDRAKLDEMARRMEEAGQRMEAAQARGDAAAATQAMGELMGAMAGANGAARAIEARSHQALGLAGSVARAEYVNGERRVSLSITDMGGMAGLAALAGWAGATVDRETADEVERVYKDGGRTVREHQGLLTLRAGSRRRLAGPRARRPRGGVPVAHNERATRPWGLPGAGASPPVALTGPTARTAARARWRSSSRTACWSRPRARGSASRRCGARPRASTRRAWPA